MKFDELELDIAKEIIHIGLTKAADSMSFFINEKVFIRSFDFKLLDSAPPKNLSKEKEQESLYVLTTSLKGELGGICYLLFSEEEAVKILKAMLPPSELDNKEKVQKMTNEILLEIDNIIVASVVTQFANFFKYKTYGDVPNILHTNFGNFDYILNEAGKKSDYCLYFRSEFQSKGIDLAPEFIWLLNNKYIDGVKAVAKDNEMLHKIRTIGS